MKTYFYLQYKRVTRVLKESGINPYLAFVIAIFLFVALSHFVFEKIMYAHYLYALAALVTINFLGNSKRNEFLKNCFTLNKYRSIRLAENLVSSIPFIAYLLYQQEILISFVLLLSTSFISFFNTASSFQFVIPTPFYKNPFEFIIGFRKTFLIIFISYFLTVISIYVGNFNLGIFALIIIILTCLNFYSQPEPIHYLWIYNHSPKAYLIKKIKVAISYSFILTVPILVSLSLFNLDKTYIVILFNLFGILSIIISLLGKYAFYPSEINLSQGILIGLSLIFPPVSLIIIPILYNRSTKNLAQTLHD